MNDRLFAELRARRNPDGGWPVRAGLPSNAESTALALMAFGAGGARRTDEASGAIAWLLRSQADDGSWSYLPDVPLGRWPTSLALLALGAHADAGDAVRLAVPWLARQEARKLPWLTKLLYWFAPEKMSVELNPSLNGWPWVEGSFSWVEPTSYALLALKRHRALAGRGAAVRIEEGERMILDRACERGGWNYGNSRVLGEDLDPYPDTTAVALLGLQGMGRVPEVERGLGVLGELLDGHASGVTLALARLAERAWGAGDDTVRGRLEAWAGTPDDLGETRGIALALIALGDGPNSLILRSHR